MAETITHTWQTVEQAAVILNVSTRTIARRLAGGSLESRVDENGRRLVLVQQINPNETDLGETADDENAEAGLAVSGGSVNSGSMPATVATAGMASSQAVTMLTVLQSTVTAARDDARSARASAKWAWAGVATMAAVLIAGAALVSSTLTRTTVTGTLLREQLAETKGELRQTQAELMATRTAEAQATRDLAEARKTVETVRQVQPVVARPAATPVASATPTTQPTLLERVVSLFGE